MAFVPTFFWLTAIVRTHPTYISLVAMVNSLSLATLYIETNKGVSALSGRKHKKIKTKTKWGVILGEIVAVLSIKFMTLSFKLPSDIFPEV